MALFTRFAFGEKWWVIFWEVVSYDVVSGGSLGVFNRFWRMFVADFLLLWVP